jgi:hypothetical protein
MYSQRIATFYPRHESALEAVDVERRQHGGGDSHDSA